MAKKNYKLKTKKHYKCVSLSNKKGTFAAITATINMSKAKKSGPGVEFMCVRNRNMKVLSTVISTKHASGIKSLGIKSLGIEASENKVSGNNRGVF